MSRNSQFERIFKDNYSAMYRTAYILLGDAEQSKDIVSDVLAKLWSGGIEIQEETERAFLLRCVKNACRNYVSKLSREERMRRLYPLEHEAMRMEFDEERWERINQFIADELPPQTGRVMKLCFVCGYSYKEAAEELEVSTSAVNKHIVNGLKKLRAAFKVKES